MVRRRRLVIGLLFVVLSSIVGAQHMNDVNQVRHSGLGFNRHARPSPNAVELVEGPLTVNCTSHMCEGPLKEIYCHGQILYTAWQFGVQDNCPGEKLNRAPEEIIANFNKLVYPINASAFSSFCDDSFVRTKYLEQANFPDWTERPPAIANISNANNRKLALEINRRWKVLGRQFSQDVRNNASYYPVISVPNPFVVPGGEFDIYFYWDSYWAIKGLLVSNMNESAKGIIRNFAYLVETHGFIPNSGKLQLSKRSQPPLFTQMVSDYFSITQDANFTSSMLPFIEKELAFWERERMAAVKRSDVEYKIFQYRAPSNCPRPENFLVDYYQGMNSSRPPTSVWSSTASACESGWDFSSRWFAWNGTEAYKKQSIRTNNLVPVDLNVFMAWNYRSLAGIYKKLNNTSKFTEWSNKFSTFAAAIDKFFWDENEGVWLDYDVDESVPRRSFFPSNIFPLLVLKPTGRVITKVAEYLERNKIFSYPGGVPTTLPVNSTEQWDFPNVWAPTMYLWVMSLLATRDAYLTKQARDAAANFTQTVYAGLYHPPAGNAKGIWEKYDARYVDGRHGGGGEYPVQEGFAWTNGAVLHLIVLFDQPATWNARLQWLDYQSEGDNDLDDLMPFLGGAPHSIIILSLIAFCLVLAIVFTLWSVRNVRKARALRLDPRRSQERSSLQRLLNDSDNED